MAVNAMVVIDSNPQVDAAVAVGLERIPGCLSRPRTSKTTGAVAVVDLVDGAEAVCSRAHRMRGSREM